MATEKQIAANRLNALKSTGPKTPQGKATCSKNSVTHGLCAASDVQIIEGESQESFDDLANRFAAQLRPVTEHERALVDNMVQYRWRFLRVRSLANNTLTRQIQSAADASPVTAADSPVNQATDAYRHLSDHSRVLQNLNTHENMYLRNYLRCRRDFQLDRDKRDRQLDTIPDIFV